MRRLEIFLESRTLPVDGKRVGLNRLYSAFGNSLLVSERGLWTVAAFADEMRKLGYPVGALDGNGRVYVGNIELVEPAIYVESCNLLRLVAL